MNTGKDQEHRDRPWTPWHRDPASTMGTEVRRIYTPVEAPARVAAADKDIYSSRFSRPESGMGGLAAAPQHRESSEDRCRDRESIVSEITYVATTDHTTSHDIQHSE